MTLYDLACKGDKVCWSPNVWKTRLVLNYKEIPYHTTWLTHTEIHEALGKLDVTPNQDASRAYTLPAIQLPDGTAIMDSAAIATKLEELQPHPPLRLATGLHESVLPILGQIGRPLSPIIMLRVANNIVVESTAAWFRDSREKRVGMRLEQFERINGSLRAWEAAKPGLDALDAFVAENKQDDGPFTLGSQVSYVDFVIVAMMQSMRRLGEDMFENYITGQANLDRLYRACAKWLEHDR